jgi:hypothetical protein
MVKKGSLVREWCNSLKISTPRELPRVRKIHQRIF